MEGWTSSAGSTRRSSLRELSHPPQRVGRVTTNACSSNVPGTMPRSPHFNPADFQGEVTLDHVIPAAEARFAPLPRDLRPELAAALLRRGVERPSPHQAAPYAAG